MNYMKIGFLVLLVAYTASAQKLPKGFESKYDKFNDESRIFFTVRSPIYIEVSFTHASRQVKQNADEFGLNFVGYGCRGFCFNSPSLPLIFLIDGERVPMTPKENVLADSVAFIIERPLLTRFAAAKLVEFKLGSGYAGKWKDKDLEKFKTLLSLATAN